MKKNISSITVADIVKKNVQNLLKVTGFAQQF